MERIKGVDLVKWKETASPGDVATMRALLEKTIDELHVNKIFHNDLHESNVMVVGKKKAFRPVIVDFGMASRTREPNRWWKEDNNRHGDYEILKQIDHKGPMRFGNAAQLVRVIVVRALERGIVRVDV